MRRRVALVVTSTAPESGALLAARLRRLRDVGWDARLLCKGEQWSRAPALADPGLRAHVELAAAHDGSAARLSRRLRPGGGAQPRRTEDQTGPFDHRLLDLRPDLVHFHSGHAGGKGIGLKPLLGCRVVVSFREDGLDLATPGLEVLWREADRLVFPDEGALERAVAQGCPSERAEVLTPPASVGAVGTDGRAPGSERLRILSAGPLSWEQGFEHSLHATRLLLDRGVDCEYRILGRGHHRFAVAFARHQLGLAQNVELVPRGSLEDEIGSADTFVDPAVTETTSPVGLHTAQAAGVPHVATPRPGLAAAAGIAVARRDPRAIADALETLARDPALRARMGEAGRCARAGSPTLDEHLAGLLALYSRALG